MFTVIARLGSLVWKYGVAGINRAITWARNNRATVDRWAARAGYGYAVEMVLRAVGLL
ncbi:hypothetical protein [uncultured Arthrobacter sp.]|uniref:hypothetical protein n=1 Tax=uncultured Arthrobacter sp. TaxID=114050 RepID=UPI00262FF74C|nr:hypothetical protein [uncultured Arthrobacter sp.]